MPPRFRDFLTAVLLTVVFSCLSAQGLAQDEPKDSKPQEKPAVESSDSRSENRARPGNRPDRAGEGRGEGRRGRGRGQRPEGQGRRNQEPSSDDKPETTKQEPAAVKEPAKNEPAKKAAKKKYTPTLSSSIADQIKWRSIGPANMGGRITAVTVFEEDPSIWWAATASGGLLKTTNNGNTFEHQFDDQATVSIGDVQVAQSNKDIVWVGTGENNPRNSVSWGDGVYKSVDGGKTWKNMGLKKTFQTGALAIHPENPDVVWVGSLGRLWGPNSDRGLYKTTDGGKTWKKVLYVNDVTGVMDVQVNPKNPDDLLVATYERKRDGFDGNDPVQRFGDGSGIYRSTDGGESFKRVSKGLPSCKMGRIGLDYFESDPKYVFAVVESEKIGKEPENYSFVGLTGEDADVGAKVTRITSGKAADKAGVKVDDIIVSVDEAIVTSYRGMLKEVHKRQAGDKIKLVIVRDRKLMDFEVTLDKKPKPRNGRAGRSDLTGTLGGQAANLQETQGPDGHEYGGVYMSEDGGDSWKRINSLNPRPMYYSNIQVDPIDRNNIYLCGTSLYRSKDGGETFTGDGGSDGIHVDHHALWIDKRDPRHMILGNDGGVHITYDRMEHWDHLNHVAIGQFYHVGVDSNLNYKVYGGLQDNGSWGGPTRSLNGSGPVNTDWFRVGGGDGFVTLADPEDPQQIYFESQNGGMGRIHLGTGARGFINQTRERGMRVRFNWKTPFILSPHNSKIHYSAGNYVFRSLAKGSNGKRISPEITNHVDKGAGSAISESAVEPGVIYAGTTDGALFVTKNGGTDWQPLFYNPVEPEVKKEEPKKEEAGKTSGEKDAKKKPATDSDDPLTGAWDGEYLDDRMPADRASFEFTLKFADGKVTGEMEGRRGPEDIVDGKFNAETGEVSFAIDGGRMSREFSGTLKEGKITGEMSAGEGRFQMDFEAKKSKDDPANKSANESSLEATLLQLVQVSVGNSVTSSVSFAQNEDVVTGEWKGLIVDDELPGGRIEFTMDLKLDKKDVSGEIMSPQGVAEISEGTFDSETNKIEFLAANDAFDLDFKADVSDGEMDGTLSIGDGEMNVDFTAKKIESEKGAKDSDSKDSDDQASPSDSDKPAAAKKADTADTKKTNTKKDDAEAKETKSDDPFNGNWSGELVSGRGGQEVTLQLKRKSNESFSGVFSGQNDHPIESGKYDPETKELTLNAASANLQLEFKGKLEDGVYKGNVDFNEGQMSMEFVLKKESDEGKKTAGGKSTSTGSKTAASKRFQYPAQPSGEKSLSKLMPGPRWVSSLEASKFEKSRCYVTFDGHRSNDDGVYVFVTNDYGQTWESLKNNIPDSAGSVRVIREDVKNRNLLFLGCEFSSWYSIDTGKTWTRIKGGLPTVSVHEFAIHPTGSDVVAGTHGRSLWVADISILRQLSKESLAQSEKLYQPKAAIRYQSKPASGNSGTRRFVGSNPTNGTTIAYSLGANARQVELVIMNLNGDIVKTFEASTRKGLYVFPWDLTLDSAGGRGRGRRRSVPTGTYLLRLKVDGRVSSSTVSVEMDPSLSSNARAELEKEILFEEVSEFFEFEDE
ncbi:MAG: PDZ domain-containing protein [Mariniblastus sp.]